MLRLTFLFIFLPFVLLAQNGNSPYSNLGLGDPVPAEYISNTAMGGVGIAIPTPFHININPAFLTLNRYTTFEAGIGGEYKKLITQNKSISDGNGNLRYLNFAFPITKKYVISLGLRPLTNVSYKYSQTNLILGDTNNVTYNFSGDGGINSIFLSQGVQLTNSISVGLMTSYNFGAINKYSSSYSSGIGQGFILRNTNQTNYRGFVLAPSIGYKQKLNKDWSLNLGAIYELSTKWGYTSFQYLEKVNADNGAFDYDSVKNDVNGKISFPSAIKLGLSIEKNYKWILGGEFKYQDWKKFKSVDGSESLKNLTSFGLGAQFVPDINAIKGYFNRVIYRLGVYYNQNTYSLTNQKLNEIGGSIGFSFPVGRLSFLNVAFTAGKRGDKNTNIIEENYYRINLGITLNDRWFIRSKYD